MPRVYEHLEVRCPVWGSNKATREDYGESFHRGRSIISRWKRGRDFERDSMVWLKSQCMTRETTDRPRDRSKKILLTSKIIVPNCSSVILSKNVGKSKIYVITAETLFFRLINCVTCDAIILPTIPGGAPVPPLIHHDLPPSFRNLSWRFTLSPP